MKYFPMFLDLNERLVVIAGGGEEAARKTRLLLKTGARLRLLAPELEDELAGLAESGRAEHAPRVGTAADFAGARLAFIATGCAGADAALSALARAAGALANVVDRPDLCDAVTPSIVDRSPLVVAIGTEGTGPVLGRRLKARIEGLLEPDLGEFLALAGRLRGLVAQRVAHEKRRAFWLWAFTGAPRRMAAEGRLEAAEAAIRAAAFAGGAPEAEPGALAIVGTGSGALDDLTLKAVRLLQEADLILHPAGMDLRLLEAARRDSERRAVGSEAAALMIAAAQEGRRVVRLWPGEGTDAPEIAALRAAGLEAEIARGIA